jgi:hypothetical protein
MARRFINPFDEMKQLYQEAEEDHRQDDEVLRAIYEHADATPTIKGMIERRWAKSGGRYIGGEYRTFKEETTS